MFAFLPFAVQGKVEISIPEDEQNSDLNKSLRYEPHF